MNALTLGSVTHDLKANVLSASLLDADGVQVYCRVYHPLQIEDFRLAAGEHAQKYIDLAGWTPEYIAAVKKKEEDEAAEKQAIADAEEAELKAKRVNEQRAAFDAEVARQVAVLEAAQAIVSKKK